MSVRSSLRTTSGTTPPVSLDGAVVPQNEEAEERLLGALLDAGIGGAEAAAKALAKVRETGLTRADFYKQSGHGAVFAAIEAVVERGEPCEILSVERELEQRRELASIGGTMRVRELAAVAMATNLEHFAHLVREAAVLRDQSRALKEAQDHLASGPLRGDRRLRLLEAFADRSRGDGASWLESADVLLRGPDPGPTPFAVESLLADRAVAAIVGPPKTGKTWLALELALAIVSGRPAFGRFSVPDRGPVVTIFEESGRDALHRRLDRLSRGSAIRGEELAGFHFAANQRVRLNDPYWRAKLIAGAKAISPRAIFLDPLARLKGAEVDESSQKEIAALLDFMRDLRDESGAAVVFVHHTGHEGGHMRGSSDLEAYWESKLAVTRDDAGVCELQAEHREAEASEAVRYRLVPDERTESIRLRLLEKPKPHALSEEELDDALLAYIGEHPGASKSLAMRAVPVKAGNEAKLARLNLLVGRGAVRVEKGPKNADRLYLSDEAGERSYVAAERSGTVVAAPSERAFPDDPATPVGGGASGTFSAVSSATAEERSQAPDALGDSEEVS